MLLDRRKVKFWQKVVFGTMAGLMAAFLIFGYSGVLSGCQWFGAQQSATQQLDDEIATLKARLAADPADAAAWRKLGEDYVLRANQQKEGSAAQRADWRAAVTAYRRADRLLARQKGAEAKRLRLDTLDQLVNVYLFLEDYAAATAVYGRITDLKPRDPQAFFDMATVAIKAGDTNTAILAFRRFLELAPDSPEAPAVRQWLKDATSGQTGSGGTGQ